MVVVHVLEIYDTLTKHSYTDPSSRVALVMSHVCVCSLFSFSLQFMYLNKLRMIIDYLSVRFVTCNKIAIVHCRL